MGHIHYEITIEIHKGNGCDHHRPGEKFRYPEDIGKICPWLLDSLNTMIRVLQFDGTLPWKYSGTEYEKLLGNDGSATEFVRCPDPTDAGVIAKISRARLNRPKKVGWS